MEHQGLVDGAARMLAVPAAAAVGHRLVCFTLALRTLPKMRTLLSLLEDRAVTRGFSSPPEAAEMICMRCRGAGTILFRPAGHCPNVAQQHQIRSLCQRPVVSANECTATSDQITKVQWPAVSASEGHSNNIRPDPPGSVASLLGQLHFVPLISSSDHATSN